VPDAGTLPSVNRFPSALGDAIVAAETLRHGLGNAATGGIWRVRGTAGSAVQSALPKGLSPILTGSRYRISSSLMPQPNPGSLI